MAVPKKRVSKKKKRMHQATWYKKVVTKLSRILTIKEGIFDKITNI